MSKDLVALLRRPYGNLTFAEKQEVANLIEELEAKLTKAVEALKIDPWFIGYGGWKKHVKDTLAELKGQNDE